MNERENTGGDYDNEDGRVDPGLAHATNLVNVDATNEQRRPIV